jgi:uncharacterized protein YecE (DUF72 family)
VIKTGITAWAEPSLIKSGWYPPEARSPAARLAYYASQFPLVENDSSYYAVPGRTTVEDWCARTPSGFTMSIKAFASLTGHYTDPRRLPPELRAWLPRTVREKPRVYPKDLGPEILDELGRRLRDALTPLQAAGKLGVLLFQYPVWFPISREHRAELARLRERFSPYRVAIEFRNATWMSEENREQTLALLAAHDLVYACVDEPQGFVSSVPPIAAATSELAMVRLHGRNAARWNRAARTAAERFDYRYSLDELRAWVAPIVGLAEHAREVHVLFNNCHADHAVTNARQMTELLAEAAHAAPYVFV